MTNVINIRKAKKLAVWADLHIPFHNPKAIKEATKGTKKFKPEILLLNGDICDFYSISRWLKDPKKRNLAREIELTRKFLVNLRDDFPSTRIIYKSSNHEKRLQTYLRTHAEQLSELPCLELPNIFDLDDLNIEWLEPEQTVLFNNRLLVLHGDEVPKNICTVYPSKKLLEQTMCDSMASHVHRVSHCFIRAAQKEIEAWTTPCLCDLTPEYSQFNSWQNGYCLVEFSGHSFNVDTIIV